MEPDNYQQAWRAQSAQTRVTVEADQLLTQVQHSQQVLRAAKFIGDFGVIGVLLLLLPAWIYMGVTSPSPWTWYLMVPADIWIIGFILVDRARQKRKPSESGEPLLKSVKESLALVEHQIWLERNNLWWYLLPTLIPMLIFFAHVVLNVSQQPNFALEAGEGWLAALFLTGIFVFLSFIVCAVYASVYYLLQRVARKHYEPRRQELLALLSSLSDETASEVSGAYPMLMSEKRITPRRMWVGLLCFLAGMLIVIAGILVMFRLINQLAGVITDSGHDGPPRSGAPAGESPAKLNAEQRKEKNAVGLAEEKQTTDPPIVNVVKKVNAEQDQELYRHMGDRDD